MNMLDKKYFMMKIYFILCLFSYKFSDESINYIQYLVMCVRFLVAILRLCLL